MGIFTEEFASTIPAAKLFKANVLDGHILCPKLMPEIVKSAAIVKGDGGAGSIRQINFTEAFPFKYIKESIDVLDKDNLGCKLTLIEGGHIGTKLEWATVQIKVESAGNGSVYKVACEYKPLDGVDYTEAEVATVKNGIVETFKAIEAYLVANPDYA